MEITAIYMSGVYYYPISFFARLRSIACSIKKTMDNNAVMCNVSKHFKQKPSNND